MTLKNRIEPVDYRRAVWLHMKPRRTFAIAGVALVVLALLMFGWALYILFSRGEDLPLVLGLGTGLAWLAGYFFVWLPRQLNRIYDQQKLLHAEITVEITDEHLVSRSVHGESKLPWSVFHKWKSGGGVVLLYQSDALFHIFVSRWFPSTTEFEGFQDILRRHVGPEKV
jgi:hypothetical protein